MALNLFSGSGKKYIYIIGGKLCEKVDEGTPGSRKREHEKSDKSIVVKYEIEYKSCDGVIKYIDFKDTDFGQQCNVEFEDFVLTLDTSSRYFIDFAKKLPSINIEKPVEIAPYDWEPEPGRRSTGLNIIQDHKKAKSFYWDEIEKKPCHNLPVPIGNTEIYKSDDWKVFYINLKKFLVSEVQSMGMSKAVKREKEEQSEEDNYTPNNGEVDDIEIPITGEKKEKELKIEDVPF